LEALQIPPGIDAIIVPSLQELSVTNRRIDAHRECLWAKVVLKWVIVRDKQVLYMNTFVGEYCKYWTKPEDALSLALKDHFDQAYRGIVTSTWWKSR